MRGTPERDGQGGTGAKESLDGVTAETATFGKRRTFKHPRGRAPHRGYTEKGKPPKQKPNSRNTTIADKPKETSWKQLQMTTQNMEGSLSLLMGTAGTAAVGHQLRSAEGKDWEPDVPVPLGAGTCCTRNAGAGGSRCHPPRGPAERRLSK